MSIQKQIAAVLISRGLNAKGAAGVIGNAYQESGLNPASEGDGGGGLWGFTSGAISLGSLQSYAASKGEHWTSAQTQANFLMDHLSSSDVHALNAQPNARAAASWFMNNWERPYVPTENASRRMDGAAQTYQMIQGDDLKSIAKNHAQRASVVAGAPQSVVTTTAAPSSSTASTIASLLSPTTSTVSSGPSVSVPDVTAVRMA